MICRKIKPYITAQGPFPNPSEATCTDGLARAAQPCDAHLASTHTFPGTFARFLLHFSFGGVWITGMTQTMLKIWGQSQRVVAVVPNLPAGSIQDRQSPIPAPGERKGPESTRGTFWLIMSN